MKKNGIKVGILPVACAAILLTAGCGSSQTAVETTTAKEETAKVSESTDFTYTYSAFDMDGKEHVQTITQIPQKVITNNQSSTELLLKLGLEKHIIATVEKDNPTSDDLAAAYDAIPVLSDKRDISKEKVVGMEPDIVIGRVKSFTAETFGTVADLNAMGIPVYTQESSRMGQEISVDSIITDVKNMGEIFQVKDKTEELAQELTDRLSALETRLSSLEGEPLKVLLMVNYKDGTFGGYGNNASLQKDMLKRLHAVNVLDKGGSALSAENLISMDPDVIVYVKGTHNEENDKNAVETMVENNVIQSVKAIKNQKIISVEYNELMGGGLPTFDCMEKLADFLYPTE